MIRIAALTGTVLLAAACGDKDDDSGDGACGVILDETFPANGASSHYYRGAYEVTFDSADDSASITLKDSAGNEISGELTKNDDSDEFSFQPDAALEPSTSYTAEIDWCGGSETRDFSTSDLGEPLADKNALVGQVFVVDLTEARFVQPAAVGDLIQDELSENILLAVESVAGGTLVMSGALSDESGLAQDTCLPTLDIPEADFAESPYWEISSPSTEISVADITVEIQDLVLSGTFTSDGSSYGGGVLMGEIDTRPLIFLVDSEEPGAICDLAINFGAECAPCGDGEPYCLTIEVDQLVANAQTDLDGIEPIVEEDCHKLCEDSVENKNCPEFYVPPKK